MPAMNQELRIFVAPVRADMDRIALQEFFEQRGCKVQNAFIPHDRVSERPRSFGYVTFEDAESFEKALSLNGQEWYGRTLDIKRAEPRSRR